MRKGTLPMRSTVPRMTLVTVATAVSLLGLALLAGGGYMLVAGTDLVNPEPAVSAVSAQEPTSQVQTVVRSVQSTALPTPTSTAVTDLAAAAPSAEVPPDPDDASQPADSDDETNHSAVLAQADSPTATATRVVRATYTPTPTSSSSELPDTGFGEFLQPIAGFGLAGIALTLHAIRKRR